MLRLLYCHWFGLENCLHIIYCYLFIYYFPVIFAVKGKLSYLDQLSLAFFFFFFLKSIMLVFNRVQLFVSPWIVARPAPLSMGFSRQENWSGLPFSSPGDFPNPGIEPESPELQFLYHLRHISTVYHNCQVPQTAKALGKYQFIF